MIKKIQLIPVLAILLGVFAAFAFRPAPCAVCKAPQAASAAFDNSYFQYVSGDVTQSSSYTEVSALSGCGGANNICGIWAPENGTTGKPVISTALQNRISTKNTSAGDVFLKN